MNRWKERQRYIWADGQTDESDSIGSCPPTNVNTAYIDRNNMLRI